jgi:hypothetical protein
MSDELSAYYEDLLSGAYDCIDRIVLNAYFAMGHSPAGFRHWWRQLFGSDDTLDDTHLMRLAGRFSRRLYAYAQAHHIPVLHCDAQTRKHEIAEEHLAQNPQVRGLFLVLVSRAQAPVWEVKRGENGYMDIRHKSSLPYVNHYSFHINDPDWGHITIKICGHPPFPAQIMLNGHEYVACQLNKAGHAFTKEGNCFTHIQEPSDLAFVADALRREDAIGRLSQVCERWIYSACLCFALSSEEREQSRFAYQFSVYQVEYSRNLLFQRGSQMEEVFQALLDRTRSRLNLARIKTILGVKRRPFTHKRNPQPRLEVVVERPVYDLTVFKVHFGKITFKGYTKGERVLRFEAIVHNTKDLGCGRVLAKFGSILTSLLCLLERFLNSLHRVDRAFINEQDWEQMSTSSQVGKAHVGGVDVQKARMRAVLEAVMAMASAPGGFSVGQVAAKVGALTGQTPGDYGPTQASYDLRKLRGKNLIVKVDKSRRYEAVPGGLRAMSALLVLRERVIKPVLASLCNPRSGPKAEPTTPEDTRYEAVRLEMSHLLEGLGIAA